jgi:hypothetical protein
MTRVGIAVLVVILVAGIALGVWQQVDPQGAALCVDGWRERVVWGPQEECVVSEFSLLLSPHGLTVNGDTKPMAWAKTQVAGQEFTVSGVLSIYGPEDPTGEYGNHSLRDIWLSTGEIHIWLTVQGMTSVNGVMNYWWSGYITDGTDDHLFSIYVPADDDWHDFEYSITQEATLHSRTGANPIGAPEKTNQTHAKEGWAEDQWQQAEDTQISITFGSENYSWNVAGGDPASQTLGIQTVFTFSGLYPIPGLDLAKLTVAYNQAEPDFSHLDAALSTTPATANPPRVTGSGNELHWYVDGWPGGGREASSSLSMSAPRMYSFSGLSIVDMTGSGTKFADLLIHCPAVEVYNATAEEWQHVCQTLAAWQAASYTDTWGCYSWDTDPPPDGAVRLLADVTFYIDADSGQAHNLDGFA